MSGKVRYSVNECFHRQVKRFPDHTALVTKSLCLTYKELNRTSNRVAHSIPGLPGQPGNAVVLLLEHDASLISAMLGVLKAGKVYVPLTPSFPFEMLGHMVSDSGAFAVITDEANLSLAEDLSVGKRHIINIDRLEPGIKDSNPGVTVSPLDHAYIIYTSGSSGRPKGVLHTHRNIVRMAEDYSGYLGIGPGDRAAMVAVCGFSISVMDIYSSLLTGAALCLFDIRKNGVSGLVQWLANQNITLYHSTPTLFSRIVERGKGELHLPCLRVLKLGGEPVYRGHWEQFKRLFGRDCLFVIGYGLSEILAISHYSIRSGGSFCGQRLPVGFVSPGCEVLLLKGDGKRVKEGETGEIAVRSDFLFSGYWGEPDLTDKVLRRDPDGSKAKIFLTGDMGRMSPDGCIHLLGRKDLQVKIRGVRVQPEEIEAVLCSHHRVKQALINVADDGKGGKKLEAMVVPHGNEPLAVEELRLFLHEKLPCSMIPSDIILVAKLPRTTSDKLDRKIMGSVFYFRPEWKRTALPLSHGDSSPGKKECWVVFTDDLGIGEQLMKKLRSGHKTVVAVKIGDVCRNDSEQNFSIRPDRNEDFFELAKRIKKAGLVPVKIVYMWAVSRLDQGDDTLTQGDMERGIYGPVYLVQAFTDFWSSKIEIELVTESLFDITGQERLQPAASLILGPFRVIPREYPYIACRCVDMFLLHSSSIGDLAVQLLAEFETGADSQLVAYRKGVRYSQTLERIRPDKEIAVNGRLRENGVYLVTGGMGGMGLAFARFLAKRVRARLVLTGRSQFPPRDQWDRWLDTHDKNHKISARIRQLLEIESEGAEVSVIRANVCDRVQMAGVVENVMERFGEINGVIHAAGIVEVGRMAVKIPDVMERVLGPKIKGILNLDAVLKRCPEPDFLMVCSSVTALAGRVGQIDYSAANAFLDAWAHARATTTGTFIVSINWDTWKQVGMAVDYQPGTGFPAEPFNRLNQGLTTVEGTQAFEAALQLDSPQVVVSKRYFEAPSEAGHPLPPVRRNSSYVAPRDSIEFILTAIWEKVLKVDHIGVTDNFFHLGGDSLTAADVFSRVETVFGAPLVLGTLVQSPTIEALASVLRGREMAPRWKYLVEVQPNGRKRPFFCVHPLSGNVMMIAGLRQYMPNDRPFYAIQSAGLSGEEEPVDRVEVMAFNYLREVREVQPEGPYLLGGRCFGGMVAFEMARQLAAEGQETALLVIIEGPPPRLDSGDGNGYTDASHDTYNSKTTLTTQTARFKRVRRAHKKARFNYSSQPFQGELVLFSSRYSVEKNKGRNLENWRKAADRGVHFHEIPCHHLAVLKEPHSIQVAALLKKYIDRADKAISSAFERAG